MTDLIGHLVADFEAEPYLMALIAVAKADGVKDVEREFIERQASMLGADVSEKWGQDVELAVIGQAASAVTRRAIVRDCLIVASIDGDFSDNERQKVVSIASELTVSNETVAALEKWLHDYSEVLRRGALLVVGTD